MTRIQLLRKAIRCAGNQARLGKHLGVTQGQISKWLTSYEKMSKVSEERLEKMCKLTNVKRADVLGTFDEFAAAIDKLETESRVRREDFERLLRSLRRIQAKTTEGEDYLHGVTGADTATPRSIDSQE